MKLTGLTREWIREFAGATIYSRGSDYSRSGNVQDIAYDPDAGAIHAVVAGNYGDYDVAIEQADGTIEASCDCPYDGYPCKHIVAVLLSF
ncbi:MAG: SWIM zinc finger domain-containing protein, partial [Syntrophobacteraceae bacterium]